MVVYIALLLLISVQGSLPVRGDCEAENKALARDGVSCYECGRSNRFKDKVQSTVVGKLTASPGDFPWHATLFANRTEDWEQICGGTLVTSRVVITSAVCVTNPTSQRSLLPRLMDTQDLRVVLGKTTLLWNQTDSSETRRKVTNIRIHPEYKGSPTQYAQDIALITLDSEVPFNRFVMPACLNYNLKQLTPNGKSDNGYVSGFGYKEECGSLCSNQRESLQYTISNVMNFNECFETAQTIEYTLRFSLTPDKYCIGNGSVSPIQKGDSGGGFTEVHHGLHYLTGVASIKITQRDFDSIKYSFGAVTNVTRFMNWIKENILE